MVWGLPFVHISTDYVFDGAEDPAWLPDDPPAPLGAYRRTKLAGTRGFNAVNGTYTILRTAWFLTGRARVLSPRCCVWPKHMMP